MINFSNTNKNTVADNKVSFCGLEYLLTDTEAEKLKSILDGMVSTRSEVSAPVVSRAKKSTTTTKKSDKDFPDLGAPTQEVGDFITLYEGGLVRYWEKAYTPNKVKYGIKQSLKDAGAVWNAEKGAFQFTTKKAAGSWLKAQKERVAK